MGHVLTFVAYALADNQIGDVITLSFLHAFKVIKQISPTGPRCRQLFVLAAATTTCSGSHEAEMRVEMIDVTVSAERLTTLVILDVPFSSFSKTFQSDAAVWTEEHLETQFLGLVLSEANITPTGSVTCLTENRCWWWLLLLLCVCCRCLGRCCTFLGPAQVAG